VTGPEPGWRWVSTMDVKAGDVVRHLGTVTCAPVPCSAGANPGAYELEVDGREVEVMDERLQVRSSGR
jgi:hypothetical protein